MTREGYLKFEAGALSKSKKRYFKIDGCSLNHFKDKGKEHTGTIQFGAATIQKAKKKKAFDIIVGTKTHTLIAESDDEALAWIKTLKDAQNDAGNASDKQKMSVNDFDLLALVGKGSFGKVMQVRKKDTGAIYAMKLLSKKHIVLNNEVEHTKAERNILEKLNHPFLMNLVYSFQTDDKLIFIMEFVNGGELFHHLQREKRFEEPRVVFYAAEILTALQYLHENGVIYRDLKPENLLLRDDGHITLTDFGLCKQGLDKKEDRTDTFCGTPEYLAPEVLKGEGYTKAVDWWSYGSLVYEMLAGLPPFYSQDVQEMYKNIMTQPLMFNELISEPAQDLLTDLLRRDLSKRLIDPEKMRKYAFFDSIDWKKLLACEVEPPYIPPVSDKSDVRLVDPEFVEETPDLDLGDDDEEVEAAHFDKFTYENTSALSSAN
eukprot:CAMPEP_0168592426 /NCGR_PEP_ID=MMETSP0420-20121227/7723_1 /TAXON_ID=498008 /ORGANISM="Pessonella sp." /LENGTH=430 /DNA_ID=CAMNT_0008628407 /DNA_START=26 /DNA_END=1318 /DNA_ORIENTATION=+